MELVHVTGQVDGTMGFVVRLLRLRVSQVGGTMRFVDLLGRFVISCIVVCCKGTSDEITKESQHGGER